MNSQGLKERMNSLTVREPIGNETDHDVLREHLFATLGLVFADARCVPSHYLPRGEWLPDLDELRETEWPEEARDFVAHQQRRFIMAAFRYSRFGDPEKRQSNFRKGLEKKLTAYDDSGNMEHLLDAGNYLILERMWPSHPQAHFRAEDDHCHCPRAQVREV